MRDDAFRGDAGAGAPPEPPAPATDHPHALIEALLGQVSEGLLLVGGDRRLRAANERAVELLELPPSWPGALLTAASTDYRLVLTVTSCFDHARPVERSLSDGHRGLDALIRALPVGGGRRVDEVLVVVHDRTELRRLETIRRDFSANLSHELRTPAAAIKLMVDTLQAGAIADPGAAEEFVGRIGEEAAHMSRMIEELLELSAIESEQRVRRVEPVAVPDLLASLDRLRPLADANGVDIELRLDWPRLAVLGEPLRLEQVIRNITHNAIKFSPPGGTVTVSAAPVRDGTMVEIAVTDRGPGIPPEDLPRVFERFWKGDASRRRDGEGTGLGLAIARHIAEGHGGSLTARSQPGAGSTFTLTVPAAPTAAKH